MHLCPFGRDPHSQRTSKRATRQARARWPTRRSFKAGGSALADSDLGGENAVKHVHSVPRDEYPVAVCFHADRS